MAILVQNVNHDCDFANASLHCYSAFELWDLSNFLPLFTAVIDCVLNLPSNERQLLSSHNSNAL